MLKLSAICATTFTLLLTPAFALPGGGDKGPATSAPAKTSPKALKCKRSETVKRVKVNGKLRKICAKLKKGALNDTELYQQARTLADEHEYEWALDHLRLISNQADPTVLTYTGYAHRKAGRLETGISYYRQALSRAPDHVQAREYLGEAYVLAGFTGRAAVELLTIRQLCGTDCEAYQALEKFITQHQP